MRLGHGGRVCVPLKWIQAGPHRRGPKCTRALLRQNATLRPYSVCTSNRYDSASCSSHVSTSEETRANKFPKSRKAFSVGNQT